VLAAVSVASRSLDRATARSHQAATSSTAGLLPAEPVDVAPELPAADPAEASDDSSEPLQAVSRTTAAAADRTALATVVGARMRPR
jgi:hypothetical protein